MGIGLIMEPKDYYARHLYLKKKISATQTFLKNVSRVAGNAEVIKEHEQQLAVYISRFKYNLEAMKANGITMTDLVLLEAGIEVDLFKDKS